MASVPIEVNIESTPEKALKGMFFTLEKEISYNAKLNMVTLADQLADSVCANIDSKGKRGGNPEWIIVHNPTPLKDTWDLFDSIEGLVTEESDAFVGWIGTDKKYAKILHTGGETHSNVYWKPPKKKGRGTSNWEKYKPPALGRMIEIPARPFMYLTDEDKQLIDHSIHASINTAADKAFLERL